MRRTQFDPRSSSQRQVSVSLVSVAVGACVMLVVWAGGVGADEIPFEDGELLAVESYNEPRRIASADLDGNGTTDIVYCAWNEYIGEGKIVLLSNLGGDVWQETTVHEGLASWYTLALGDIDGDGDGDILAGVYNTASGAEVAWFANPKNGSNTEWAGYTVHDFSENGSRRVALGDVDRDGDLDAIVSFAGESRGLIWVENDGSPTDGWGDSQVILSSAISAGYRGLAMADVDVDGDLDIVVGMPPTTIPTYRVAWIENISPVDWDFHGLDDVAPGAALDVAVGDLNGDGLVDVVATTSVGSIFMYININRGSSWTQNWVTVPLSGIVAKAVSIDDLDDDGDNDILAASQDPDESLVWFDNSSGHGGSWEPRPIDGPYNVDRFADIQAVDIDVDGDLEVVAAMDYGVVFWRNRRCHRRFNDDTPAQIRTGLADPRALEVADLNGDGLEDVVAALWDGGEINAYISLDPGANLWWTSDVATSFTRARGVSVADVNGDGDPDILGAAVGEDAIRWWENDGGTLPVWTVTSVLEGYDGAHSVEPADFDRDGDIDLAVCAFDEDSWAWMENTNGMGTAWSRTDFPPLDGAFDLVVGDLNFDGAPDIVATGYDDGQIWAALNPMPSGNQWTLVTVAQGVGGPRGADVGDLDGDGDLDIVAVIRIDGQVLWFENDGTGFGWTQHTVSQYFADGTAVRAVDLDGDGDTDVVASAQSSRVVKAWINSADGTIWSDWVVDDDQEWAWDLDVADIDDDGREDVVVVAGGTSDRLVWYADVGNQFGQRFWNEAPPSIAGGEKDVLFAIRVEHYGLDGHDSRLEPSQLTVEFTDGAGDPLTSDQINDYLDRLEIYMDTNGTTHWEPEDAAVQFDLDISLSNGVLSWELTDGLAVLWVDPGESEFYFLVATAQPDVDGEIIATLPAYAVEAEDVVFDIALASEPSESVSTGVLTIGGGVDVIFADGFECGDTDAWSWSAGE